MDEFEGLHNAMNAPGENHGNLKYWIRNYVPLGGYLFIQELYRAKLMPQRFQGQIINPSTMTLEQLLPDWCDDLDNEDIQRIANIFYDSASSTPKV